MNATLNTLVWHDQFKTAVLANAATFGLVAADTTPITNDNTDFHAKITNLNSTQAMAEADWSDGVVEKWNDVSDKCPTHPGPNCSVSQHSNAPELQHSIPASDGVNIYSKRDGDVDFVFLARDTATPYLETRLPSIGSAKEGPLKVAGKPEIREYKAMFVLKDEEIGIFSHELAVNCAP